MRRLTLWFVSTVSAVVVLFAYHTSTGGSTASAALAPATPGTTATPTASADAGASSSSSSGTSSSGTSSSGTSSSGTSSSGSSSSSSSPSPSSGKSGTFTGSSVDTRWGPVQVKITVTGGKITDVQAVVYPDGNGRDQEINSYALPALHDEVIAAQSAQVDAVSGATVTSDGYLSSLQSALDAANL